MPEIRQKVTLIRYTPAPEELVAMAAKLCYSSSDLSELEEGVQAKDQAKYLKKLTEMGHLSPIEHASFTFGLEGVSRSLLAQITRHRIASFSVQSQRYVGLGGENEAFGYVVPGSIRALGEEAVAEYERQMNTMDAWYQAWRERIDKEDARFVLPNAAATRIIMTMNARELIHFLSLRCCNRAQWEIRKAALTMFALAYRAAPALFENAGPGCVRGACPEGKMTCGRVKEVHAHFNEMKQTEPVEG